MKRGFLAEAEHESSDSAPAWMVSYGDMMSLLLTLFVMLVSMSEIKQNDRFQGVADSLHEQFSLNVPDADQDGEGMQARNAALAVLAVAGRQTREKVMSEAARRHAVAAPRGHGEVAPQGHQDVAPQVPAPAVISAPTGTPEKSMVRVSLTDDEGPIDAPPTVPPSEPPAVNPNP